MFLNTLFIKINIYFCVIYMFFCNISEFDFTNEQHRQLQRFLPCTLLSFHVFTLAEN